MDEREKWYWGRVEDDVRAVDFTIVAQDKEHALGRLVCFVHSQPAEYLRLGADDAEMLFEPLITEMSDEDSRYFSIVRRGLTSTVKPWLIVEQAAVVEEIAPLYTLKLPSERAFRK